MAVTLWLAGAATAQTLDTVPDFEGKPDFKAIARASDEVWGASWGRCSLDVAIEKALGNCQKGDGGVCKITRLGDTNVAGLVGSAKTDQIERYRDAVETDWLARSRGSGQAYEFMLYGGEADGWDEFVAGRARFNTKSVCMTAIDGSGPSIRCTGYARFAGSLHGDGAYPIVNELVVTCNGQKLEGEAVGLEPGHGFTCLVTPNGGRVMGLFGAGSHSTGTTRDAFLGEYYALVAASGLDRELCGWGLLIS